MPKYPLPPRKPAPNVAKTRAIMEGVVNAELASLLEPYYRNRPLARLGFDPNRMSILSEAPPTNVGGFYFRPIYEGEGITEDILYDRGQQPIDRVTVNPSSVLAQTASNDMQRSIIDVLLHEFGHRGKYKLGDDDYNESTARAADIKYGGPDIRRDAIKFIGKKYARGMGLMPFLNKELARKEEAAMEALRAEGREPVDPLPPEEMLRHIEGTMAPSLIEKLMGYFK